MRARNAALLLMLGAIFLFFAEDSSALTTDELLRLKTSGVSEDIIVFMAENDYKDIDKVVKMKEAGFRDESILAIIKSELKGRPTKEISSGSPEREGSIEAAAQVETFARVKIMWYMIYRGESVLQNSQAIENAKVSLVSSDSIKFEWKDKGGLGLLDFISKKPFKSPFYWKIDKGDKLENGLEGYAYMLKSTTSHKGVPDTDGSHYWVLYLEPKDAKIIDHIKDALQ